MKRNINKNKQEKYNQAARWILAGPVPLQSSGSLLSVRVLAARQRSTVFERPSTEICRQPVESPTLPTFPVFNTYGRSVRGIDRKARSVADSGIIKCLYKAVFGPPEIRFHDDDARPSGPPEVVILTVLFP